jgi:Protein of unknown function (DUF3179)
VRYFGSGNRWIPKIGLCAVLAIEAMVIVRIVASERASRQADEARMTPMQRPGASWQRNHAQPIVRPPTLAAETAKLPPEEMVIGVVAGGKARAYRLSAFEGKSGHLVNDMIGGAPVSVAYCNLTRCVRVYTDPEGSAPLNVEVSGTFHDEMILKLAGNLYYQKSGQSLTLGEGPAAIPYDMLTPTLTTWKEWTKQHPDTDVYMGNPPRNSEADAATIP